MTNKEIARKFRLFADILELHNENRFKIRSYTNAAMTIRKYSRNIYEMPEEDIIAIKGVGKAISAKIQSIKETGSFPAMERYLEKIPPGIIEMLQIKGLGPSKIKKIWKELDITTPGELQYACSENRLAKIPGFGEKTQENIRRQVDFYFQSLGKHLYASIEKDVESAMKQLDILFESAPIVPVGQLRRKAILIDKPELLLVSGKNPEQMEGIRQDTHGNFIFTTEKGLHITLYFCRKEDFGTVLFQKTGSTAFLREFETLSGKIPLTPDEQAVFDFVGIPYIEPELREDTHFLSLAGKKQLPTLIEEKDIKGILHCHTTYTDGGATLREMALHVHSLGYDYLGITDHSQSAVYAHGLYPDRVRKQMHEIDELNKELAPFKIFKGIEVDILNDGQLDYDKETLALFDFTIASIHTNLRMDKEKAMERLLKAIENPYTTILGHLTGRLLLSREGYPIDHRTIIDACAKHNVVIELNANPRRLDIDYTWIPYALEKGVKIAIDPDAHSLDGVSDVRFGVLAARKGGLTKEMCINTLSREAFGEYISSKKTN